MRNLLVGRFFSLPGEPGCDANDPGGVTVESQVLQPYPDSDGTHPVLSIYHACLLKRRVRVSSRVMAERTSRMSPSVPAIFEHDLAVDDHVLDARAEPEGLEIGGAVDDSRRVEDRHIRQ